MWIFVSAIKKPYFAVLNLLLMGGSGVIAAMITTLENNRNLLRSNKGFMSRARIGGLKKSYKRQEQRLALHRELSLEERQLIRDRIRHEYRNYRIRSWSILVGVIAIFIGSSLGFINYHNLRLQQEAEAQLALENLEKDAAFRNYNVTGDGFFSKGKYNQASHYYYQAHLSHPKDANLAYKLALSYKLSCEEEHVHCTLNEQYIEELKEKFPEEMRIRKIHLKAVSSK